MAWHVDGDVLIACNCDWGCPCNFQAMPSRGKCEGGWIWSINRGVIDNVDVAGLAIALFANWPKAIHDGGGRAVCFIDERSGDQQRLALTRLVRGELGGPWGIFINTYDLSGPSFTPFHLELAGYDTSVTIGDNVDLQLTTMRNPVTHNPVHPEIVLPEGMITRHGKLAASKTFRVRSEIDYDHSGQYAAIARFEYASST